MPKITIDGKEIEVAAGTSVIQAAEQAGVRVPMAWW
jgi:NADH dehydrogenase/NADH:ubiquinone oxidoreductase subunit G